MKTQDRIKIEAPVAEWTVFQQQDGYADICLFGAFCVSRAENHPVIRAVDAACERTVLCTRPEVEGSTWRCDLRLPAGMYRIETGIALEQAGFNPLYLGRGDVLRHIFVGEVFAIAGQSNAAGYGRGGIDDMPQFGVSMLTDTWRIAAHPIGQAGDGSVNEDALNCGHSAWLSLGKQILQRSGKPVGLIPTALSGSGIDAWLPGTPLYENMVRKAREGSAGHLVWYQGCTDVFAPEGYERKLETFIDSVRHDLGSIAIYLVQIGGTTSEAQPDAGWRAIREAQRRAAIRHKTYLIPAYDLTRYSDDIHLGPQDNRILAGRVYQTYADGRPAGDIRIRRSNALELTFTDLDGLDGKDAENLVACDEEGKCVPCRVSIQGNKAVIESERLAEIRAVTLPFGRLFEGRTLHDRAGNPLPYFNLAIPDGTHGSSAAMH